MSYTAVTDLAAVIYSSGKVFDGLQTGRLDTETFLRSGSIEGIASRADLALLEDLRDVAAFVLTSAGDPIDADYVRKVNAQITRSGPLHPGELRTASQNIGVRTRHGRHTPVALTPVALQSLIDTALRRPDDTIDRAIGMFIDLARAQPFEDGNKRTALFVANSLLIGADTGVLLTIPFDEDEPSVADTFNDLLARAYLHREDRPAAEYLRAHGIVAAPGR